MLNHTITRTLYDEGKLENVALIMLDPFSHEELMCTLYPRLVRCIIQLPFCHRKGGGVEIVNVYKKILPNFGPPAPIIYYPSNKNSELGYHSSYVVRRENKGSTSIRAMMMRMAQQCHCPGLPAPHLYLTPHMPALAKNHQ